MLEKFSDILLKVQRVFFSTALAAMALILTAHVIMRFVFKDPLVWTDEVVTMMQGVLAFAGIGYCFHKGQHTDLALLYDRVPKQVQWIFDIISNGVMLFCCILMIRVSIEYTIFKDIPLNTIPWMRQSWFYGFIAVGFVLSTGYVLARLVRVFKDIYLTLSGKGKEVAN